METKYNAIGLFTGCGGSSLGLKLAGFNERLAIDFDENAVETHDLNFPDTKCIKAMIDQSPKDGGMPTSKLIKKELKEISRRIALDLIQLSPPCQFFSMCNTFGYDEQLIKPFFDSIEIIAELKPKVFIIENVEGALSVSRAFIWNKLKKALTETGYSYDFKVLDASDYGVPQCRKRLIIVGIHPDLVKMGFVPVFPKALAIDPAQLAIKKVLPSKPKYFSMTQFKDEIISGSKICHTITKTPNLKLYDALNMPPRKPTIEELKILSSFPESFQFIGSYSDQVNRIGNCVPPYFMRAIALAVRKGILDPYYATIAKAA